jgi:hypothetical protein
LLAGFVVASFGPREFGFGRDELAGKGFRPDGSTEIVAQSLYSFAHSLRGFDLGKRFLSDPHNLKLLQERRNGHRNGFQLLDIKRRPRHLTRIASHPSPCCASPEPQKHKISCNLSNGHLGHGASDVESLEIDRSDSGDPDICTDNSDEELTPV